MQNSGNNLSNTCSFGEAIEAARAGKRIRRRGWNGKNQYVELATCISYKNAAGEIVNAEHDAIGNAALAFVGTSGVQLGWLASQADMLATDWEIMPVDTEKTFDLPFSKAFDYMLAGHKVRRKGWGGYWFWNDEDNTIMIQCRPEKCMGPFDIRKTEYPKYTFTNIAANDWEVVTDM